jgi:hypothetical protein
MALRIGGGQKPPMDPALLQAAQGAPAESVTPTDMPAAPDAQGTPDAPPDMPDQEDAGAAGGGEVDKDTAGYLGPEDGPFMCKNCTYYGRQAEGTCAIVAGHIDPEGCCNLFTNAGEQNMPEDGGEMQMEEPMQEPEAEQGSQEGY